MNNRIKIPATRTTRPTAIRMVVNDTRDASGTVAARFQDHASR